MQFIPAFAGRPNHGARRYLTFLRPPAGTPSAILSLLLLFDLVSAASDTSFREPTLRGAWPGIPTGPAVDVAAAGNRAIVSTADAGLWCYDISTLAAPRRMSVVGGLGAVRGVAISGTMALATAAASSSGTNLYPGGAFLIDLSGPTAAHIVGKLERRWSAGPAVMSATQAFVADSPPGSSSTVRILDISDPGAPREVAGVDAKAVVAGLVVDGDRLYFVRRPWTIPGIPSPPFAGGSLRIVDISTLATPLELGDYHGKGLATDVTVFRKDAAVYACVANGTSVEIVDVTQAQAPRLVGELRIPGVNRVATGRPGVVCAAGDQGLAVIDVTSPSDPRSISTWSRGRRCIELNVAAGVAFLALGEGGWRAISLDDPRQPTAIIAEHTSRYTLRVAASGSRVYLANLDIGLEAVDVANPEVPRFLGDHDLSLPGLYCVATDGARLCAGRGDSLLVYEIDHAGRPIQVGTWQAPGAIDDIVVDGDLAYLAAESAGLVVVSLGNPANPRLLGTQRSGRIASRVAVAGTRVSLSAVGGSMLGDALEIIDVGDPSAPRPLGTYPLAPYAGAVASVANTAFVAEGGWTDSQDRWHPGVLKTVDISTPGSPRSIGAIEVGGAIGAMVPTGGRLYVCTRPAHFIPNDPGAGVHVFDIRNPANPVRLGSYPVPSDDYSDLALAGDLLVVANLWNGFLLLDPHLGPHVALQIARTGGSLRLEWPASRIGAELQSASEIPSDAWQTLPGFAGSNVAVLPHDRSRSFFRLKSP